MEGLQEELLLGIFAHLPLSSVCTISVVCRTWQRVANDEYLWAQSNLLRKVDSMVLIEEANFYSMLSTKVHVLRL